MKIAVITLHRVFNYGSVLQAYATQKIFEKLGYDVEIIDYIPSAWQNKNLFWNISISRGFLKDMIYRLFRAISIILKKKSFGGFLKRFVRMTKKYYSIDELCKNPPVADIYCTGSDQVWNSKYNGIDRAFFLDFCPNGCKKIAFSSSFGKTELPKEEEEEMKSYLAGYELLTLRENSAVEIVEKMGLNGSWVLDPTLLIDKKDWIKLSSKRLIKEKYLILMLLYSEDNNATEIARKIADAKGLKLVKLSWEMLKDRRVDILKTHRKPEDFLSLFYYADFVVTNSFHGLAFSINLNKQFVVVKRNEFNSRIESLLELVGLEERMIENDVDMMLVDNIVDYAPVNDILDAEREKTMQVLKGI